MSASKMKAAIIALVTSWGDMCAGGSGPEIVPSGPNKGQKYGQPYYNLAEAIRRLPEPAPGPIHDGKSLADALEQMASNAIKGAWSPEDPDYGQTTWRAFRNGGESMVCLYSSAGGGTNLAFFPHNGWPGSGEPTAELVVLLANNLPKIVEALRFAGAGKTT